MACFRPYLGSFGGYLAPFMGVYLLWDPVWTDRITLCKTVNYISLSKQPDETCERVSATICNNRPNRGQIRYPPIGGASFGPSMAISTATAIEGHVVCGRK